MPHPTYADQAWRDVRALVLQRDAHRCRINGPKCRGRATQVDHIVPVSDGGARLDPSNLQAACVSCNVGKRNTQVAAAARAARGEPTASTPTPPPTGTPRTRAESIAMYGYTWPAPPGGWPDDGA